MKIGKKMAKENKPFIYFTQVTVSKSLGVPIFLQLTVPLTLFVFAGPHFAAVNNNNEIIVTDFHNHSVKVSFIKKCLYL